MIKQMKNYKFYGHNTVSVKPINEQFNTVKDQRHLYDLLSQVWSKETCAPRMQKDWSKDNMTLGQCSITSFLVQDIFGGEVYGVPLEDGNYHCFNKIGDVIFDLTSEQFGNVLLDYEHVKKQDREEHLSNQDKYERYLLLKGNLINLIKGK